MSKAAELAALIGSQSALSNRNLVINGAMQVAQRGTSFDQAGGAVTYSHPLDRFRYEEGIEQWAGTMSQSTDVPSSLDASFKYSLKIETTTVETTIDADDFAQIVYYFEGYDGDKLAYGTSNARVSTLSFYVRSSVTGTYCLGLSNQDGTRTLPLEYTVDAANTWQRIELTVPAATDGTWGTGSSKHLGIRWLFGKPGTNFDGGTNGVWASDSGYAKLYTDQSNTVDWLRTAGSTLFITGVQLEVGEQATPFEHRSFGDELARCQRYYQHLGAQFHGKFYQSNKTIIAGQTIVTMRAAPTVTLESKSITIDEMGISPRTFTASDGGTYGITKDGIGVFNITGTHGGTVGNLVSSHGNFFKVDAEL